MSDLERATRAGIHRIVEACETFSTELAAIRSSLPASEREDVMYAGEEEWDFPTEARSVIECVLADWLGPAIRDLQDASVYGITEGHVPD